MKRVPVSGGKFALVDDEDYDRVAEWTWSDTRSHRGTRPHTWLGFASDGRQVSVAMHLFIMGHAVHGMWDHINRDPYDNRRSNLRIVTRAQNNANKCAYRSNSSGVKGVSRHGAGWRAFINFEGKRTNLGTFRSFEDAVAARREAAERIHGEFAGAP